MPHGAAPRALLAMIMLIMALAVAMAPAVDARKDKKGGNEEAVATESLPLDETSPLDAAPAEVAPDNSQTKQYEEPADPGAAQTTADEGRVDSNERTLLSSDADGDYLPDALDNCPNVQNPDQADADGDGAGDACPVYADYDGDGVADKDDNCPNIATYDYADRDGDGIGDACDKSPDGIEPEPEPLPDYDGQGGEGAEETAELVNGEGQDGTSLEREGKSRSKERSRTENSKPIITTGEDGSDEEVYQEDGVGSDGEVITEGPEAVPYEEPARDNPRRNEELVAEAAASGELYAPPEPPPAAQKAWDEEEGSVEWKPVARIDAGATDKTASDGNGGARKGNQRQRSDVGDSADSSDAEAGDSGFARGWMRARLLLQDDAEPAESEEDPGDGSRGQVSAPVPVENGLVITGKEKEPEPRREDEPEKEQKLESEPADGNTGSVPGSKSNERSDDREKKSSPSSHVSGKDGSRRNGSSRAASPNRDRSDSRSETNNRDDSAKNDQDQDAGKANNTDKKKDRAKLRRERAAQRDGGNGVDWEDDRYFDGGSAVDWSGDIDVAGTDEEAIYLTQRSGSGQGKRRGFTYAIPVEEDGSYMVRLYFAEPYWGAPEGPEGDVGKRVFSVAAEGDALIEDLDIFAEAGSMSALVKQAEVEVDDGELNLQFVASEGEPIVAAIEVLRPAG